ncbi:MAG TPA: transglutaminase family protein [Pirellulales bacterium]|jgi:transglutaminase-like putative cysteine protease|nr:transglutaminase family protein [Pirellulales bacterium]
MLIKTGFELIFNTPAPTVMLAMLFVHPDRTHTLAEPERLTTEPELPRDEFIDSFGNRVARLVTVAGRNRLFSESVVEDHGQPDVIVPNAPQLPIEQLPVDVLPFLLSSRYCEVDKMSDIAWQLFGNTPGGWPRVKAICDWAHGHVEFGYKYARVTKSAHDVYEERKGVCRDFTHLAITLCRCMNIPARYATGYLGDIGVPVAPDPMDFSAWFEVYLGDRWYTFDARHNKPRIGRIVMARGRDAVDTALTTSFGPAQLLSFKVWTDELVGTTA